MGEIRCDISEKGDPCDRPIAIRCLECSIAVCDRHHAAHAEACAALAADIGHSETAARMGRAGGRLGGVARAASLSPKRRSEIASIAARKRWHGAR